MGYVAEREQVKKTIKQLQRVKTWQLLLIFVLLAFISATFLRLNNVGMVERRRAVSSADKAGDATQIQERLYDLQRYAASHMNAETGSIYLQEQYNRDAKSAMEKAAQATNGSGTTYQEQADAICKPRFSGWSPAYVQCVYQELTKMGGAESLPATKLPDENLYHYRFYSPLWSPDFAGFSVLATLLVFFVIISRFTGVVILRVILKLRYKAV